MERSYVIGITKQIEPVYIRETSVAFHRSDGEVRHGDKMLHLSDSVYDTEEYWVKMH